MYLVKWGSNIVQEKLLKEMQQKAEAEASRAAAEVHDLEEQVFHSKFNTVCFRAGQAIQEGRCRIQSSLA